MNWILLFIASAIAYSVRDSRKYGYRWLGISRRRYARRIARQAGFVGNWNHVGTVKL